MLLFIVTFKEITYPPSGVQEQKISLNLSQFVPPPVPKPVVTAPKPEPLPVIPPTPQPVKKEPVKEVITPTPIVKKKLLDEKKRFFVEKRESKENNATKVIPKKEKKVTKKKVQKKPKKTVKKKSIKKKSKKRVIKRKREKRSKDPLANALMGSGTSMFPKRNRSSFSSRYGAKTIKKLYGKEFHTFSSSQQKFIKNNLGTIHRITQRTLTRNGYPAVAVQTKQQGINIVSFYLHPNGDISGLRLKKRMGYTALDKNTLSVIRIAYKDYPLPNKKTKIIFYVKYTLY